VHFEPEDLERQHPLEDEYPELSLSATSVDIESFKIEDLLIYFHDTVPIFR
jgi:hypothetical protein